MSLELNKILTFGSELITKSEALGEKFKYQELRQATIQGELKI